MINLGLDDKINSNINVYINENITENCLTPAPIILKSIQSIPSCKSDLSDETKINTNKQKYNKVYFQKIKQKFCNQSSTHEQQSKNSLTQSSSKVYTNKCIPFQSQIIKNFDQLKGVLDLDISPYSLKRVFKASDHNFDVRRFHQLCGHFQNTVTIAEINNGNIVGGYTPLSWRDNYCVSKTHYKTDKNYYSFLFNFTCKQKYNIIKNSNNKAIVGCHYLGPTFGGGYDFSIGNYANKKYSSSCDFPTSYTKDTQLRSLKLNRKSLIGVIQELFYIKQWEVFIICPKNEEINENSFTAQDKIKRNRRLGSNQGQDLKDNGIWKYLVGYFSKKVQEKQKNDQQI